MKNITNISKLTVDYLCQLIDCYTLPMNKPEYTEPAAVIIHDVLNQPDRIGCLTNDYKRCVECYEQSEDMIKSLGLTKLDKEGIIIIMALTLGTLQGIEFANKLHDHKMREMVACN